MATVKAPLIDEVHKIERKALEVDTVCVFEHNIGKSLVYIWNLVVKCLSVISDAFLYSHSIKKFALEQNQLIAFVTFFFDNECRCCFVSVCYMWDIFK